MTTKFFFLIFLTIFNAVLIGGRPIPRRCILRDYDDENLEDRSEKVVKKIMYKEIEMEKSYWYEDARRIIKHKKNMKLNKNIANNIILFMGDGMSLATIKAARIYEGQSAGTDGERTRLAMENFPFSGLVKTYCLNSQVPDSACTTTAFLGGAKGNYGTVGLDGHVERLDCMSSLDPGHQIESIAGWAQKAGKRTGLVTTTPVTDASPAGVYAHTADRRWQNGAEPSMDNSCQDVAKQLVLGKIGKRLNVILGGGRTNFIPETELDEEGCQGSRKDERNLIEKWVRTKWGKKAAYVYNRTDLFAAVNKHNDYILGLFDTKGMHYYIDNKNENPTLEEMTEMAIRTLSRKNQGYFLFVEGGLIDKAHHKSLLKKALTETIEFSKAIQKAHDITSERDTLIVVIADHSHVLTMSGPAPRGGDILGMSPKKGSDDIPYSILSYVNGPGYRPPNGGKRYDFSEEDTSDKNLLYPAYVPLPYSRHSGEDVGIFASGPWAHLFTGVIEQHLIPHIMAFASCIGSGEKACKP